MLYGSLGFYHIKHLKDLLTYIGKCRKQDPKIGCVTERYFWKQNPDKNPEYLVISLIFWVIFWDTCSWKGQLGRTRSWKNWSWKEPSVIGKNWLKLERTEQSWKEPSEVGKLLLELECFAEVGKFHRSWKVLAEVGKFEWTWKVVTDVEKFIIISKLGLGKLTN